MESATIITPGSEEEHLKNSHQPPFRLKQVNKSQGVCPPTPSKTASRTQNQKKAQHRFDKDFVQLEKTPLGTGSFASVLRCRNRADDIVYAIKKVTFSRTNKEEAMEEVTYCRKLSSHGSLPNIIRFYDHWEDEVNLFIQLECAAGDITRIDDSYWSQFHLCNMMSQVSNGLHYMHQAGLSHCDVKPKNILFMKEPSLTEPEIIYKLCDFDRVNYPDGDGDYMAPELLVAVGDNRGFYPEADIYALGITALELIGGRQGQNILPEDLTNFNCGPAYDENFQHLLRRMRSSARERPMVIELKAVLATFLGNTTEEMEICSELPSKKRKLIVHEDISTLEERPEKRLKQYGEFLSEFGAKVH